MSDTHATKYDMPEGFANWSEWDAETFKTEEERVAYYIDRTREQKWKIVSPVALSWTGWDMWKMEVHKNFPVRAFFQLTVRGFLRKIFKYKIGGRLSRIKWSLIHRYVPRHQYHILRPATLKPGYHDPSERILHGVMEDFRVFFEQGASHVDWSADPHHQEVYEEMKLIYDWWVNEYPKQDDILDERYPIIGAGKNPGRFLDGYHDDEPDVIEWKKNAEMRRIQQEEWAALEEEMLIRLMKIRRHLWYL